MNLTKPVAIAAFVAMAAVTSASAAELRFLCVDALQPAMPELLPQFQQATGHHVRISYANVGTNTELLRKGEQADLAMVSPQQWESLQKEGKIDPTVRVVVGKVGVGLFVRKGALRPDVGSIGALKQTLLAASSIAVRDPGRGSPVGARIVALFERLGIQDEIKPKLRLTAEPPFDAVISGRAEIGFSTMAEIAASSVVDLVGAVPVELQNFIVYTAAVPVAAKEPAAAKALIEFLGSHPAISVLKSKGIEPR
jgi:molybdate transport system substrate-binding protein